MTVISIIHDGDSELYVLQVSNGLGRTEPAGARLFRGGEIPDIEFSHATEAGAIKDAALLQAYLNSVNNGPSKAKLRKEGAQ